jgi:hypothetical protein
MGKHESDQYRRINNPINEKLEEIIAELSNMLKPIQLVKQKEFNNHKYPFAFIIGTPRSGSTLLLQWLANLGSFSYPSNVLNRFAYAPYVGALIQQMLFNIDYDYSKEFQSENTQIQFNSNLGKTIGYLSPNEFQFFFRNFMNNFDPIYLNPASLLKVDFKGIYNGLCSIESVFDKPFVCKIVLLQFHLSVLRKHIPNSVFLFIKRNPIYNMQSILNARIKYYGDKGIWWSVKPMEYDKLKELDIYHQIAGQVYYTNKKLEKEIEKIPDNNKILIEYEQFCADPDSYFFKLQAIYDKFNVNITNAGGNVKFISQNNFNINYTDVKKLEKAYEFISSNDILG